MITQTQLPVCSEEFLLPFDGVKSSVGPAKDTKFYWYPLAEQSRYQELVRDRSASKVCAGTTIPVQPLNG